MTSSFAPLPDQPFRVALIAGEVAVTGPGVALLLSPEAAAHLARGLLEVVTKVARAEPRSFAREAGDDRAQGGAPTAGLALRAFD